MRHVIDIGAASYPRADWGHGEEPPLHSMIRLRNWFLPDRLHAFDPQLWEYDGYETVARPWIAATFNGKASLEGTGPYAKVVPGNDYRAFDLAEYIKGLGDNVIIVKIDAEGSEWDLLPHLHKTGVDANIDLLIVEWHGGSPHEQRILEQTMRCPVMEWRL